MSVASILAKCGFTASDVRRISAKSARATIAEMNERKYNPDDVSDEDDDRLADAEREADALARADFGLVSNSHWDMNTRIGG